MYGDQRMSSPGNVGTVLRVAVEQHCAMVHVVGRGTFKDGPPLRKFLHAVVDQGCTQVLVDLDDCSGMDSTFMGVLAGLALRMKREECGHMTAVNLSAKLADLLDTLGLDRVIQCFAPGEESPELRQCLTGLGFSEIGDGQDGKKVTLETMLEAHEDLVAATPDNRVKFEDVITYLRQDLEQLDS